MIVCSRLFAFLFVVVTTVTPLAAAAPPPPAGFRSIFNGKDLTGWYGLNPHSVVKLEGEELAASLKKQREEFSRVVATAKSAESVPAGTQRSDCEISGTSQLEFVRGTGSSCPCPRCVQRAVRRSRQRSPRRRSRCCWGEMMVEAVVPSSVPSPVAAVAPPAEPPNPQDGPKNWYVESGELVNDGNGPYATTEEEFGDIEFLIDYKTVAKADSGIYLRGTPQIQIWDTTEEGGKWDRNADKGSGGLFNNTKGAPGQLPLVNADQPFGEWNHFRIRQVGAHTWVWLNDKLVVDGAVMENYWDRTKPLPSKGPIMLQTHGGEIRWRNLYVREIPPEEAKEILKSVASK
jgi:hypothetical protein